MSRLLFDGRFIRVPGRIVGLAGVGRLDFALDTGATSTMVSHAVLSRVGIELDSARANQPIVTAGGVVRASRLRVPELMALGVRRTDFPVLAFDLPPEARIDGLLGLDFLRDRRLVIDFRAGTIDLG